MIVAIALVRWCLLGPVWEIQDYPIELSDSNESTPITMRGAVM
jgi:hypothetical protein